MMKVLVFFADGVEPIEAVTIVDVLRRADVEVTTVSLTDSVTVNAAHKMTLAADAVWADVDFDAFGMIVLPGGGKGTEKLLADERVLAAVRAFAESLCYVAALCAAPAVLAKAGLLEGRRATCFPTCAKLLGESYDDAPVIVDGRIITGQGPGSSMLFTLVLVQLIKGEGTARDIAGRLLTTFE